MTKSTLSILISIIILAPIAALAQNIQNKTKTNPNSVTVRDATSVIKNSSQATYKSPLNHNDYSVPVTPNAQ